MYNLVQFGGFRASFASQLGASERVSRVNLFSSGLQSAFRESYWFRSGFRARFASQLVQFRDQSVFRESIEGFRARFASHWFSSGLQSAFRESIGSVRGFRARLARELVQFGASERVSRVDWFSSGLQSAFRESIGSVRGFRARFASHIGSGRGFRARFASQLVQFGASERVSRVNWCIIWFSSGL